MSCRRSTRRPARCNERGYILITLIFFAAVIAIMAAAALPAIVHEAKRDREEELIHRGVQYTRAIRLYYKKFGRYPASIENLENTNNFRFLRQRYKDPITGQDFKLLRYGDLPASVTASMGGLGAINPQTVAALQGQNPNGLASINPAATQVLAAAAQQQQPVVTPAPQPDAEAGTEASSNGPANPATGALTPSAPAQGSTSGTQSPSPQVFGGGGIFGVASTAKGQTIREFNKLNHYKDWLFIYVPALDRGGLLTTPYQKPGTNLLQPPVSGPPRVESTQ